jgi:ribosomal protein S18 acetylase RimI-like enzyme
MIDRELLLRIEHAGVAAWPALETAEFDGWLWRFSDGGSQRANSVSALAFSGSDVEASIDEAERRYAARGASPMFQVSDVSAPADLDARLQRRGYRINDPCTTLVKSAASGRAPDGVVYLERASPGWFDCYSSVITPGRKRIAPQILARIPASGIFCGLEQDGRIVATALGVPREDVIIAECVATLAEARGKGAASWVMRGIEVWGAARGCRHVALQAVVTNAPAQALYKSLGYRENGRYHLRVKDRAGA